MAAVQIKGRVPEETAALFDLAVDVIPRPRKSSAGPAVGSPGPLRSRGTMPRLGQLPRHDGAILG